MPGRKFSAGTLYRYGFNGKENDSEIKGEGNQVAFEERIYESRIGRFLSMDPIAYKYPFQSSYTFAANSPVALIDILGMGPGDPVKHTVVKGDNLSKIARKYGVSIKDVLEMNDIKDKNKIMPGQVFSINPEADFSNNPRGGYKNPDNAEGKEVEVDKISKIGTDFVFGKGEENSIIVGGKALESVKNWAEVKSLVSNLVNDVYGDGKAYPGEAYARTFSAGNLPYNIFKGFQEGMEKIQNGENPWKGNSQNSPIHIIGSFNISIRVNANGTSATISVYDSKTFKSASDGNAGSNSNRAKKDYFLPYLTNTYQRYVWNINLSK